MRIALLVCLAASAALAQEAAQPLTPDQARAIVPRADLRDLNDAQRGVFVAAATELFNYAGCQDTLAKCLAADQHDAHALRMALLLKELARQGFPATPIVQAVEKYYASFDPSQRLKLRTDDCPVAGKGAIALVEFSDYQCPHCAAALIPLEELIFHERKGKVRLCSKYFPFSTHPRARIAALCAEYARQRGKFWEMNAQLFVHQEALEDADLKRYAKGLGLNGEEMLKEVYAGKFDEAVERNRREGMAAGVESTPSLFIDGRLNMVPVQPWFLAFTIDDEIAWQREKGWRFESAPQKRVAKGK